MSNRQNFPIRIAATRATVKTPRGVGAGIKLGTPAEILLAIKNGDITIEEVAAELKLSRKEAITLADLMMLLVCPVNMHMPDWAPMEVDELFSRPDYEQLTGILAGGWPLFAGGLNGVAAVLAAIANGRDESLVKDGSGPVADFIAKQINGGSANDDISVFINRGQDPALEAILRTVLGKGQVTEAAYLSSIAEAMWAVRRALGNAIRESSDPYDFVTRMMAAGIAWEFGASQIFASKQLRDASLPPLTLFGTSKAAMRQPLSVFENLERDDSDQDSESVTLTRDEEAVLKKTSKRAYDRLSEIADMLGKAGLHEQEDAVRREALMFRAVFDIVSKRYAEPLADTGNLFGDSLDSLRTGALYDILCSLKAAARTIMAQDESSDAAPGEILSYYPARPHIAVVADTSGSVSANGVGTLALAMINSIIGATKTMVDAPNVSVWQFSDSLGLINPPTRADKLDYVVKLKAVGGTQLTSSLNQLLLFHAALMRGPLNIIVITDGAEAISFSDAIFHRIILGALEEAGMPVRITYITTLQEGTPAAEIIYTQLFSRWPWQTADSSAIISRHAPADYERIGRVLRKAAHGFMPHDVPSVLPLLNHAVQVQSANLKSFSVQPPDPFRMPPNFTYVKTSCRNIKEYMRSVMLSFGSPRKGDEEAADRLISEGFETAVRRLSVLAPDWSPGWVSPLNIATAGHYRLGVQFPDPAKRELLEMPIANYEPSEPLSFGSAEENSIEKILGNPRSNQTYKGGSILPYVSPRSFGMSGVSPALIIEMLFRLNGFMINLGITRTQSSSFIRLDDQETENRLNAMAAAADSIVLDTLISIGAITAIAIENELDLSGPPETWLEFDEVRPYAEILRRSYLSAIERARKALGTPAWSAFCARLPHLSLRDSQIATCSRSLVFHSSYYQTASPRFTKRAEARGIKTVGGLARYGLAAYEGALQSSTIETAFRSFQEILPASDIGSFARHAVTSALTALPGALDALSELNPGPEDDPEIEDALLFLFHMCGLFSPQCLRHVVLDVTSIEQQRWAADPEDNDLIASSADAELAAAIAKTDGSQIMKAAVMAAHAMPAAPEPESVNRAWHELGVKPIGGVMPARSISALKIADAVPGAATVHVNDELEVEKLNWQRFGLTHQDLDESIPDANKALINRLAERRTKRGLEPYRDDIIACEKQTFTDPALRAGPYCHDALSVSGKDRARRHIATSLTATPLMDGFMCGYASGDVEMMHDPNADYTYGISAATAYGTKAESRTYIRGNGDSLKRRRPVAYINARSRIGADITGADPVRIAIRPMLLESGIGEIFYPLEAGMIQTLAFRKLSIFNAIPGILIHNSNVVWPASLISDVKKSLLHPGNAASIIAAAGHAERCPARSGGTCIYSEILGKPCDGSPENLMGVGHLVTRIPRSLAERNNIDHRIIAGAAARSLDLASGYIIPFRHEWVFSKNLTESTFDVFVPGKPGRPNRSFNILRQIDRMRHLETAGRNPGRIIQSLLGGAPASMQHTQRRSVYPMIFTGAFRNDNGNKFGADTIFKTGDVSENAPFLVMMPEPGWVTGGNFNNSQPGMFNAVFREAFNTGQTGLDAELGLGPMLWALAIKKGVIDRNTLEAGLRSVFRKPDSGLIVNMTAFNLGDFTASLLSMLDVFGIRLVPISSAPAAIASAAASWAADPRPEASAGGGIIKLQSGVTPAHANMSAASLWTAHALAGWFASAMHAYNAVYQRTGITSVSKDFAFGWMLYSTHEFGQPARMDMAALAAEHAKSLGIRPEVYARLPEYLWIPGKDEAAWYMLAVDEVLDESFPLWPTKNAYAAIWSSVKREHIDPAA